MAEVAAHLVDRVFPRLPVLRWVRSLPKRLRYFLERDTDLAGQLLRVLLLAVEPRIRQACPGAPLEANVNWRRVSDRLERPGLESKESTWS